MKIKQILAILVLILLTLVLVGKIMPSRSGSRKVNVNIDDVKYEAPFIYYDGGLLTGSATTLYENGKIHKIINSNKGKIRNQTHFNQQGDTIATMYYMQNGSFLKYVDKTIKNNIVEFNTCMEKDGGVSGHAGICIGSRNIPVFEYRLARLQDLWIKRKGLQEKLKTEPGAGTLLAFEGSTRMGGVLGKTEMYLTGGVSYPSYYNKQPEGPFNIKGIAFTVRYGYYGQKSYSEQGRFASNFWGGRDGSPFRARYKIKDESHSQNLEFFAQKEYIYSDNPDGNFYSITLTISNKSNTYQSKMNFYDKDVTDEENGLLVNDIWDGTKIESQPGYSFYNFNLEWHYLHNDEVAQAEETAPEVEATATEEVAPEPEAPAAEQAYSEKKLIDYMSKNDGKVYTDTLVLGDLSFYDQNLTIMDADYSFKRYYISTFYMTLEKYSSVFENYIGASLPFDLNDFDEHKGKVYEIEYIKRNWVENYVDKTKPIEGKFLTKMTLIE